MAKKIDGKKPNLKLVSNKKEITKIIKPKDQPLTQKQLEFSQYVADGFTKADAFRKAYDVSVTTTEKSVHEMVEVKTDNNSLTSEELQDQLKEKLQKLIGNN